MLPGDASSADLTRACAAGCWARARHKDSKDSKDSKELPLYEMGLSGHQLRKAWRKGWDDHDRDMRKAA